MRYSNVISLESWILKEMEQVVFVLQPSDVLRS